MRARAAGAGAHAPPIALRVEQDAGRRRCVAQTVLCSSTMVVTSTSSRALAMPPSPRLADIAPRILENVAGGILELVIHAVEGWRERRDRVDR